MAKKKQEPKNPQISNQFYQKEQKVNPQQQGKQPIPINKPIPINQEIKQELPQNQQIKQEKQEIPQNQQIKQRPDRDGKRRHR